MAHAVVSCDNKKARLSHCFVLRLELPVHGHGEAEQAVGVAARHAHHIVGVQVEGATRRDQDGQQRESGEHPDLRGFGSSPKEMKQELWSFPESC